MKLIDRIKCFFGRHDFWVSVDHAIKVFVKGTDRAFLVMHCCVNCGKAKFRTSETQGPSRWVELALTNIKDTQAPVSEQVMEVKNLVDSSLKLDLSKMDIDVESFKKADEELEKYNG